MKVKTIVIRSLIGIGMITLAACDSGGPSVEAIENFDMPAAQIEPMDLGQHQAELDKIDEDFKAETDAIVQKNGTDA